jgi:hypothetical protein
MPLLSTLVLSSLIVGFQTKPDPFDYHCADVLILQAKPVQQEIKLTEAQRNKMNVAAQKHQKVIEGLQKKYGNQQPDEATMKKVNPQIQKSFDELKKSVIAVLSAAQLKRVREINLQRMDVAALLDVEVAKRLGLKPGQSKKIGQTVQAAQTKVAKLQQDAASPILTKYQSKQPKSEAEGKKLQAEFNKEMEAAGKKVAPKVIAEQKSAKDKVLAVLTPSQRTAFKALQGNPFKM